VTDVDVDVVEGLDAVMAGRSGNRGVTSSRNSLFPHGSASVSRSSSDSSAL